VESAAGHSNATRPFSQHNYRTLASQGETERWKRNAGEGSKGTQLSEPRLLGLWDFKFFNIAVLRTSECIRMDSLPNPPMPMPFTSMSKIADKSPTILSM